MEIRIRKCANTRCADIIGSNERVDKKYCSKLCKSKVHNDKNKKGRVTWENILEKYEDLPSETFVPFPKWLKENYYPPRLIKNKK